MAVCRLCTRTSTSTSMSSEQRARAASRISGEWPFFHVVQPHRGNGPIIWQRSRRIGIAKLKSSLDQQPLNEPRKSFTSINREDFPTISILNSTEMQRHSPRRGTPNNEQATAKMIYEMEGPCSKSVRPSAQRDEVSIGVLERTVLEGQFVRLGTPLQSDMVIVFRAIKVKV